MHCATATSLTGGAFTEDRVRPTGLSGCVTTPTTSKPSPMSARRGAVANSGVPQKSTRTLQLLLRMPVLIPVLGGLEGHAPDEAGILVGRELPLGQRGRALEDAQVRSEERRVGKECR